MVTTFFKYIPLGENFKHNDMGYIKTNFNRGYYYKEDSKVFRSFKKKTIVFVDKKLFNIVRE